MTIPFDGLGRLADSLVWQVHCRFFGVTSDRHAEHGDVDDYPSTSDTSMPVAQIAVRSTAVLTIPIVARRSDYEHLITVRNGRDDHRHGMEERGGSQRADGRSEGRSQARIRVSFPGEAQVHVVEEKADVLRVAAKPRRRAEYSAARYCPERQGNVAACRHYNGRHGSPLLWQRRAIEVAGQRGYGDRHRATRPK